MFIKLLAVIFVVVLFAGIIGCGNKASNDRVCLRRNISSGHKYHFSKLGGKQNDKDRMR
jgi:hypothetical protein